MKRWYGTKIIAVLFLLIVAVCTVPTVVTSVRKTYQQLVQASQVKTNPVKVKVQESKASDVPEGRVQDTGLQAKMKAAIAKVEQIYNENVFGQVSFVEGNGLLQKAMGKRIVSDADDELTVVKDLNGYLHFSLTKEPLSNDEINEHVSSVKEMKELCGKQGIPFLYVQAPNKLTNEQVKLPDGISDYTKEMTKQFVKSLKQTEIPVLDLIEEAQREKMDYRSMFYKTDHHWNAQTGFWACQKLMQYLTGTMRIQLQTEERFLERSAYEETSAELPFIGSIGKRTGKYYAKPEKFYMYLPKFDTDYHYEAYQSSGNLLYSRSGTFYDALIDKMMLNDPDTYANRYAAFLGGDYEIRLENKRAGNNKKVLFIKDSFALPASVYFSLNVKETRLLDPRHYSGSIYDYIMDYDPDLVVMFYNPTAIKQSEFFQFY